MIKRKVPAFLLPFVIALTAFAGNKADSLRHIIAATQNDTIKLKRLESLSMALYYQGNQDSSLYYANKARLFSDKILKGKSFSPKIKLRIEKQRATAYRDIGTIYVHKGNYAEALMYDTIALRISQSTGDKKLIAFAYGDLCGLYTSTGSYAEALNYGYKALKQEEESGNTGGLISTYTNIGNIYRAEKNYSVALQNHQKCLELSKKAGNKRGMTLAYNNMGVVYQEEGNLTEALKNYTDCLNVAKEINYKEAIAISYDNMGAIYSEKGDFEDALKNQLASKKILTELGSVSDVADVDVDIGELYLKRKQYKMAQLYLDTALDISVKSGYKETAKAGYSDLSDVYSARAEAGMSPAINWKNALENYKKYFQYNDSLFNETTRNKSEQARMQFEFDKKEAAAKVAQEKKNALFAQEKEKEALVIKYLSAGFLLVLALAFFIYRGYRLKRRANGIISRQKDIVEQKNLIIEARNKAITDSINYARLIQSAMLPPEEEINRKLKEYFIFYRPKDIVSGDFYFYKQPLAHPAKNTFYLAACDCTGHGVPGAFMSMICNEKLNDAVEQFSDTGKILEVLNKEIKLSLHQSQSDDSSRDGMDIALCAITPVNDENKISLTAEQKGAVLQFAGANRPLWIVRNGIQDIEEIKPTKRPIGGFAEEETSFDSHTINLQKGDAVYMFSDGYADQFGGPDGKKLTTKKFRELIRGISKYTMQEQKKYLSTHLAEWMGMNEQLDDILIIGVRI